MICENTIIGGYSSPYYEEKDISLVPIGGVLKKLKILILIGGKIISEK